ncbi:MAG: hypothetical protein FJ312_03690 [SAR202 cluster bacterium]|nr:hypothetical protein [SAR202 cluster bacterium]
MVKMRPVNKSGIWQRVSWLPFVAAVVLAVACGGAAPAAPAAQDTPAAQATAIAVEGRAGEAAPSPTTAPTEPTQAPAAKVGNQVGDHIPDFSIRLADGSTKTSADLLAEGKPVFLFFMATW